MHRIAIAASDPADKRALESIGLSVRPAKKGSANWRFETTYKDYGALCEVVKKIQTVLPSDSFAIPITYLSSSSLELSPDLLKITWLLFFSRT